MTRNSSLIIAAIFLVGVATLLTYLPARHFDFVNWDDYEYVINNDLIRSFDFKLVTGAFATDRPWFPLTWISLALDYHFWALNASGYHLTNVLLHSVNACLVTIVFYRLLLTRHDDSASLAGERIGSVILPSLLGGLLFALHPQRVESVAWVTERKDVLGGFFALLAVLAYLRYVASKEGADVDAQRFWYLTTAFAALCSFCSKGTFISLPLVFLILDWYPLNRVGSLKALFGAAWEKTPLFCISVTASYFTLLSFAPSFPSMEKISLATRCLVAMRSVVKYLTMQLWPVTLSPYYVYPRNVTLANPVFLGSMLVFVAITLFAVLSLNKTKVIMAAWLFFLVTMFPMLGLIQSGWQEMADRFTYFPSLGPILLFCAGGHLLLSNEASRRIGIFAGGCLSLFAVTGIAAETRDLLPAWKNTETLWSRAIAVDPDYNGKAYYLRATYYMGLNQHEKALADITKSLEIGKVKNFSGLGSLYFLRGEILENMGQHDLAIADYTTAIASSPANRQGLVYSRRSEALNRSGRGDLALADLQKAEKLGINPFKDL